MSYRTFKRALGETNLERKCRRLFGACMLVLIIGSFWIYGAKTDEIVANRNRAVGEILANAALLEAHLKTQEENPLLRPVDRLLADQVRRRDYLWQALHPHNEKERREPRDAFEWALMLKWSQLSKDLTTDDAIDQLEKDKDRKPWAERREATPDKLGEKDENNKSEAERRAPNPKKLSSVAGDADEPELSYSYYEPVYAKQYCIDCHSNPTMPIVVTWPDLKIGDLLAVMSVAMDTKDTAEQQAENRAFLIALGVITVFLAMAALYVIVRYVIVKPLAHLRDVSDAVRRGDVEQRAIIHTGDEFEELGAAFNRMLRQLLRQQDELRSVNGELDGKIDELAQVNMKLFESNQVKSDFLATVSHELRTPLNSILGFSDLLAKVKTLDEKQRRYAGNIERSGRQLLDMINDILDLAKIESGRMEVRASDFDVGAVVLTQCDLARPLSEKKHIELDCEIAPGLPPVRQDQGKIEQILNNLLSNAIKFTPDGGRIHVSARRDRRGDMRLSVTDTGVGISESEQVAVFEKFRQGANVLSGGNAMTREYSGSGLGLSIVRELCRLLGGDVTLESELGKGSEFTVILPWVVAEQNRVESPLADALRQLAKSRPDSPLVAASSTRSDDALNP